MGKGLRLITALLVIAALLGTSCGGEPGEPTCLGWKTTLEDASNLIGVDIPLPTYLPKGYKIQEVYIQELDEKMFNRIVLLISDEEIIWQGDEYQCQIEMTIVYGFMPGLKMPRSRQIKRVKIGEIGEREVWGYLIDREGEYNALWYQWLVGLGGQDGILEVIISASKDIPKKKLVKIAESTLY